MDFDRNFSVNLPLMSVAIANKFAMIISTLRSSNNQGVKMVEKSSSPGMKLRILMWAVLPMKLERSFAFSLNTISQRIILSSTYLVRFSSMDL